MSRNEFVKIKKEYCAAVVGSGGGHAFRQCRNRREVVGKFCGLHKPKRLRVTKQVIRKLKIAADQIPDWRLVLLHSSVPGESIIVNGFDVRNAFAELEKF